MAQMIIQFPGTAVYEPPIRKGPEPPKEPEKKALVFEVMPWEAMPEGYPDYRPLLQRDGLILFSWEIFGGWIKPVWLASSGAIYRYQAQTNDEGELKAICPERRYSEGRRLYTHEKPDLTVYAAPPDLTANTRAVFIGKLRELGARVNFDYEFSRRTIPG
ncbi:MAG: hypothetical protein LBH43_08460 [Treponema sp.]|nr:hypothetical protein [Treponema sp.]